MSLLPSSTGHFVVSTSLAVTVLIYIEVLKVMPLGVMDHTTDSIKADTIKWRGGCVVILWIWDRNRKTARFP